jgi:4-aminobutyrate aminotransferase-like enzyme
LATLDEFEKHDILSQGRALASVLEAGLQRLTELPCISAIRGEGAVWGIQCAAMGSCDSKQIAQEIVRACYLGDESGRAIHLLGPLSGDVLRVAPPLVMPCAEAQSYMDAMYEIIDGMDR